MTTKADIFKKISKEARINLSVSKNIFENFINLIPEKAKNQVVKISGFGSFKYHITPKRIGRNPKSKESYIIKPRKKLNFKSSNQVKKFFN
jgi:integration host factor subunit alpha